nr:MAG TPA_asm: hypothetical protein [Caudoviricetes sp.]
MICILAYRMHYREGYLKLQQQNIFAIQYTTIKNQKIKFPMRE